MQKQLTVAITTMMFTVPVVFGVNAQDEKADAQTTTQQATANNQNVVTTQADAAVPISQWNAEGVYENAMSARSLYFGTEVRGPNDDDIGSVEDVIFNAEGRVSGLIVEVGGFWDIGDQHLFVPWEKIELIGQPGADDEIKVKIPITEETAENYGFGQSVLYKSEAQRFQDINSNELETGPRLWQLSEVLGDYAYLSDRRGYGFIRDVIISKDGAVKALIVNAELGYGGGYRALPYRGPRHSLGPYYNTGYGIDDIMALPNFDYSRLAASNNR